MSRFAVVAAVVIADATLLRLDGTAGWGLAAYAVLTGLVLALSVRLPSVAFMVAVSMAVVSGASLALLVCTSYQRTSAGAKPSGGWPSCRPASRTFSPWWPRGCPTPRSAGGST